MAVSARDVVHWVNKWVWTYDPRLPVPFLPFDLFSKQAEYLRWLAELEADKVNGLAEKSRDVGFTWLSVSYDVHAWLFRNGYSAGYGSRKLDLVDKMGDPDSILEKARIILRNLPAWMLPRGFSERDNLGFCKLVNPANGSTITGEAGDQIGRGGRKSRYTVDEAAFIERPQLVDSSLSATTNCRVDVSTPNGPGNPFATKRHGGKVRVFTFHWKDDLRKNHWQLVDTDGNVVERGQGYGPSDYRGCKLVYPWYEAYREGNDPVVVAQEVDIDYSASIEGICIPAKWVRAAVGLALKRSGPRVAGLDVADEGKNRNAFIWREGPVVDGVDSWEQLNTTQTAWRARDVAVKREVDRVNFDADGVGAGVRGTWESAEGGMPFVVHAIRGGSEPSMRQWPNKKTSREMFVNLRAEMWWTLRVRFERTYERVFEGVDHPDEACISIPNHPQLISDLSLPLYMQTETGKIKLESKKDMQRRGVASPDFGDALAYSESPDLRPEVEPWRGSKGGWA